jgi:hypothetical protein
VRSRLAVMAPGRANIVEVAWQPPQVIAFVSEEDGRFSCLSKDGGCVLVVRDKSKVINYLILASFILVYSIYRPNARSVRTVTALLNFKTKTLIFAPAFFIMKAIKSPASEQAAI